MVKIIVDTCEEKSGNIERLEKRGVEIEVMPLPYSDYLLSEFHCVERKEIGDLYSSILGSPPSVKNGKIVDIPAPHNIKLQLQGCHDNFKVTTLAVIGKSVYKGTDLKYIQMNNFLRETEIFDETNIKKFSNEEKFCDWMVETATILQEKKRSLEVPRIRPKVQSIDEKRIYFYNGLEETGIETARTLSENFKDPNEFLIWFKTLKVIYTKGGNYKGYETIGEPYSIKNIGEVWIRKNKLLLFGEEI